MSLFRNGRDFYTDAVAQQLLPAAAWLLIALVGVIVAAHMLRRSAGQPTSNTSAGKLPPDARVLRYQAGARLYHWGNTLLVVGLTVSGVALFSPGALGQGAWLLLHEVCALLFILTLALHIVVAPVRGEGRSMWFEPRDARDLRAMAANFLGRSREYPAFGKYDPFQKIFHAFLTLLSAGVIVSGACLFLNAEVLTTFSHGWIRIMRLIHDVSGFAFIAVVVGHVYFGIIRVNWPQLVSMVTGRLRGASFNRYHDTSRWHPKDG